MPPMGVKGGLGGLWSESARLSSSRATDGAWIGFSVSLSGDGTTALTGARLDNSTGSGYVFVKTEQGRIEQERLQESSAAGSFGVSVAASRTGETLIGAAGCLHSLTRRLPRIDRGPTGRGA